MNFKDLVSKIDELQQNRLGTGPLGAGVVPASTNMPKTPLGTGGFRPGANPAQTVQPNPAQSGQADPQAAQTPPAEKTIPGQQPNLSPKPVTPTAPQQQVIGAQPATQQPQQNNTGMAAAILQAVNQMKTQQPALAPTSSQSISTQQQNATKQASSLQQTAKPGEPLEEENKATSLNDKEIKDWVFSLNKDPSYVTSPDWKYIDKDSKIKILQAVKANHPTASNFIDVQRKLAKELKSDVPNKEYIAQLEAEKTQAWQAHKKPTPAKPTTPQAQDNPAAKKPASADEISTQQTLTQTLGKAATSEKDPAKKAQFMKDYEVAAAKLTDMKKGSEQSAKPAATEPSKADVPAKPAGPVVTSAELQKFRDEQGNQNITLGQYLNQKNKLTARKGGANDAEVIQKQLGDKGTAWNPDAKTSTDTPPASPELDDVQKNMRRDELTRMMKSAGSDPATISAYLDKEGLGKTYPPDSAINDIVARKEKTSASEPVAPNVAPTPANNKDGYKFVKKDAAGKPYLDLFNVGNDYSVKSKLTPGDGPPVRDAEPVPVKEMLLQSVVDELLVENTPTKEDTTTTASKWATKSAKLAPWVGNVAKGANAALSASDIADYAKKGDKVGAGIASAALAADAVGTVFPPASWASFALDAANAGRDVYLKQTGKEFKDPDQQTITAKEELSNIVNLAKYKVDKK